jgi:ribosomal protein S18 acetylase RimI-like enzyme
MNDTPTIRLLGPGDIAIFSNVAEDVFDDDINPRWAAEFLNDPRHHIVVALLGSQVIGMASAVHYVHPDKSPELWVNEIGVTPAYRQRGIGKQLIAALFSRGRELGCKEAWLGTEESNTAARQLYASVGGVAQSMVYFTFDLDRL